MLNELEGPDLGMSAYAAVAPFFSYAYLNNYPLSMAYVRLSRCRRLRVRSLSIDHSSEWLFCRDGWWHSKPV